MKNIHIICILLDAFILIFLVVSLYLALNTTDNQVITPQVYVLETSPVIHQTITLEDNPVIEQPMDEIDYLARCVEAEAGNQSMLGKRLVVDVILNRVNDMRFADNIIDVINEKGQFAVVSNGAINKVEPTSDTYKAIEMELERITDTEILYFTSNSYIGIPCYHLDAHYFGR